MASTDKKPTRQVLERQSATKAIEQMMRETRGNQKELRILVTGKTGQGKSALINGILGAHVSEEGATAARVTVNVEVISKTIKGVPIKVFDSPGLQDRTANEEQYIRGMRDQCQELSLILYCTKMINPRLTDDDKHAMIKLTKSFGEHFWDYAVFVLTFANMENVERRDDRDEDEGKEPDIDDDIGWERLKKSRFEGRLNIWEDELHNFLIHEVGVSPQIANNIPVVPTGDRRTTRANKEPLKLPDRINWFNDFWEACCIRVKDTRLFLKVNSSRIVAEEDERESGEDDEQDSEDSEEEEGELSVQKRINQLSQPASRRPPKPRRVRRMKLKTEAEAGVPHLSMDALLPHSQRKTYPLAEPPGGDLSNMDIHIDRTLVEEVVEETAKRAGKDASFTEVAKKAVRHIKAPVKWLTGLFKKD